LYKYDKSLYDFSRSRRAKSKGKAMRRDMTTEKGVRELQWVKWHPTGAFQIPKKEEKHRLSSSRHSRQTGPKNKKEQGKFYTYAYTEIIKKNALH